MHKNTKKVVGKHDYRQRGYCGRPGNLAGDAQAFGGRVERRASVELWRVGSHERWRQSVLLICEYNNAGHLYVINY